MYNTKKKLYAYVYLLLLSAWAPLARAPPAPPSFLASSLLVLPLVIPTQLLVPTHLFPLAPPLKAHMKRNQLLDCLQCLQYHHEKAW